jgi:hypothetical protein
VIVSNWDRLYGHENQRPPVWFQELFGKKKKKYKNDAMKDKERKILLFSKTQNTFLEAHNVPNTGGSACSKARK